MGLYLGLGWSCHELGVIPADRSEWKKLAADAGESVLLQLTSPTPSDLPELHHVHFGDRGRKLEP